MSLQIRLENWTPNSGPPGVKSTAGGKCSCTMKLAVRVENALPPARDPLERKAPEPALVMATRVAGRLTPFEPLPRRARHHARLRGAGHAEHREHVALGVGDRDVRRAGRGAGLGGGLGDDALDLGRGQGNCALAPSSGAAARAPRPRTAEGR